MPYLLRNVDTGTYVTGFPSTGMAYTSDEAKARRFATTLDAHNAKMANEMVVYRPHGGAHD